ncbi:MAG: hypothetical protein GEU97_22630 [Actinophytocola sp.]|nr:hypothetical protein [Actinophytocola sp.]
MYSVVTDSEVVSQLKALPADALRSYDDAVLVLELAPWNGRSYNDEKPDCSMRELVFDNGFGTITYLILEDQREVHVLVVQWLG